MPQQIDIVVINDLVTDNRIHKVAISLQNMGFSPKLTGRKLKSSITLEKRSYKTHRMHLLFEKGPLFYAEFNIRLFFSLLFSSAEIILSNDLDTLPASYLASKIRGKKLVYDSHEYFTEVPELINRPAIQNTWRKIEKAILPNLKNAYTVCDSIANAYHQQYGTSFQVIRNLPFRNDKIVIPQDKIIHKEGAKIILYQGALNLGRGIECAIKAMQYTKGAQLWLAGDGDLSDKLKHLTNELGLNNNVKFLGRIPLTEMKYITAQADLGISIEEDRGLNYRFALPNKLFDYIQQKVPVMVSNLPEMKKIVENYKVGVILEKHDPKIMADQFQLALFDENIRNEWSSNLDKAAKILCWEKEAIKLESIFKNLGK